MEARILVVDDDLEVRALVTKFLTNEGYAVVSASSGAEALRIARDAPPDLVLLDVDMPGMNGLETCRALKADERTALIPVTMLTGQHDLDARVAGIEAGADDFLGKPFHAATLRARLRSQLRLKRLTDELERTESIIFSMARWVELKDDYTESHLRRVAGYGEQVAGELGLGAENRRTVRFTGILHDIGKIAIPESIVKKRGPLDEAERLVLQRHPEHGAEIIAPMRFAARVGPAIRAHHERWDGGGYPDGLVGDSIPIGARIVAVVDAWDAMTTDRPYRDALDRDESIRRLRAGAGSQWDARIVEVFLALESRGALAPAELALGAAVQA